MHKTWMQKVRTSNEVVKKAWLYGLTALSMAAVLGLWGGYMNENIPVVFRPGGSAVVADAESSSMFSVLKIGWEKIAGFAGVRLNRGLALMKDLLLPENRIIISKQEGNFVLEGMEPLARRPLVESR